MFSEPIFRHVLSAVSTATLLCLISFLAYRSKSGAGGWNRVEPSPMYWGIFAVSACVFVLLGPIRISYDRSWPDADSQIAALNWLVIGLGGATVGLGYSIHRIRRLAVQWRGTWLSYRDAGGRRTVRNFLELVDIRRNVFGYFVLVFNDGDVLRLDPYARGTERMMEDIGAVFSDLVRRLARGH